MGKKSLATATPSAIDQTETSARKTALDKALGKIKKEFGDGAVMKMGDNRLANVERLSTGILSLDQITGGGLPRGRIIEMYGPESSGKTTVALQAAAAVQKAGGKVAYIDAENALDPAYMKNLGVDLDDLLLSQPNTGEEGLEIANTLIESGAIALVVVDSVAALVPKAEIDGEIGDAHVGIQARLMSQALRKISSAVHSTQTVVIFINQLREKVGVMFGSPEVTPGGRALKFYASIRLDIRRTGQIKDKVDGEVQVVGNTVRLKVTKNKVFPPFKVAEVQMDYGYGISRTADILDQATKADIVQKSGAWYSYHDEHIGQGRINAIKYLNDRPELVEDLMQQVLHPAPDPEPAEPTTKDA
ncbi:recombinase RecA [Lactiplantibacillus songbeiensis]|uniref:Protein RecA n=1 Tax=Lactiplantibacillus songbeiensis TaxID=2559920 RepID=A0ABW4BZ47_9LACO|nr:recombinase RecA [Lactiplantibacillus songbeiensis]